MDLNITKRLNPLPHPDAALACDTTDALSAHMLDNGVTIPQGAKKKPRLTMGEAARSVGAWEDRSGYVCFGSWDAVRAFAMKMQRDMALAHMIESPQCAGVKAAQ